MRKFIVVFAVMLAAAFVFTDDAEARRGRLGWSKSSSSAGRTPIIPIIIPISSGSSSVVFVKDLPDVNAFKFKDKGFYDLGYKFAMFGGGEWVGYFKDKSGYLELNQDIAKSLILPLVGLTEADAPGRSASAQMWMGASGLLAAVGVLGFLMLRFPGVRRAIFALRGQKDEADDIKMPVYGRRSRDMPAAAPSAVRPARITPSYGQIAPASFGKRR